MWKLLKYELKGRSTLIIGGIIAFTIANLLLMANYVFKDVDMLINGQSKFAIISIVIMFLLSFVGFIVIIIDCVNLMKKDLFSDTGYLLFSTPQKGASIVGAKLIVGLIEFAIYGFFTIGFLFIHVFIFSSIHSSEFLSLIFSEGIPAIASNLPLIIQDILIGFLSVIAFILTIYLSLAIAKSLLHNKKHGGIISFIVFVVLQIAISMVNDAVNRLCGVGNFTTTLLDSPQAIVSIIYQLIICAVLFISTSYLIDNRVEM